MWNGEICLPWDETLEWFDLIGITPVHTLWRGPSHKFFSNHYDLDLNFQDIEGYVVRVTGGFLRSEFHSKVAKYVRKNHIQTDQHWMAKSVTPNKLKVQ
jgi:hypothetical protein